MREEKIDVTRWHHSASRHWKFWVTRGIFKPRPDLGDAMRNGPLLRLLRDLVQRNSIAFYGVCGGACVAGHGSYRELPGLDLLNGIQVQYDSSMPADGANVETNAERGIVQMTGGCALVFVKDQTQSKAVCFPCVKNTNQEQQ